MYDPEINVHIWQVEKVQQDDGEHVPGKGFVGVHDKGLEATVDSDRRSQTEHGDDHINCN